MSGRLFRRRRVRRRLTSVIAFIIVISFLLTLLPPGSMSFALSGSISAPLFTQIPTVPLSSTDTSTGSATDQYLNQGSSQVASGTADASTIYSDEPGSYWDPAIYQSAASMVYLGPSTENLPAIDSNASALAYGADQNDYTKPMILAELVDGGDSAKLSDLATKYGASSMVKVPGTNIYRIKSSLADATALINGLNASGLITGLERDRRYGSDRVTAASQSAAGALRSILSATDYLDDSQAYAGQPGSDGSGSASTSSPAPVLSPPAPPAQSADPNMDQLFGAGNGSYALTATASSPSSCSSSVPTAEINTTPATSATQSQYPSASGATTESTTTSSSSSSVSAQTDYPACSASDSSQTTVSTSPATSTATSIAADAAGLKPDVSLPVAPQSSSTPPAPTQPTPTPTPATPSMAAPVQSKVPVMAVGSEAAASEYEATAGSVGVRFNANVGADGSLAQVSQGDKGFAINTDDTASAGTAAAVTKDGVSYLDSAGNQINLAPFSQKLSVQIHFAMALGQPQVRLNLIWSGFSGHLAKSVI